MALYDSSKLIFWFLVLILIKSRNSESDKSESDVISRSVELSSFKMIEFCSFKMFEICSLASLVLFDAGLKTFELVRLKLSEMFLLEQFELLSMILFESFFHENFFPHSTQ